MKIHEEPEAYTVRGTPGMRLNNIRPYDYVTTMEKVCADPLPSRAQDQKFSGGMYDSEKQRTSQSIIESMRWKVIC